MYIIVTLLLFVFIPFKLFNYMIYDYMQDRTSILSILNSIKKLLLFFLKKRSEGWSQKYPSYPAPHPAFYSLIKIVIYYVFKKFFYLFSN